MMHRKRNMFVAIEGTTKKPPRVKEEATRSRDLAIDANLSPAIVRQRKLQAPTCQ
jgi:hypothetical protein